MADKARIIGATTRLKDPRLAPQPADLNQSATIAPVLRAGCGGNQSTDLLLAG